MSPTLSDGDYILTVKPWHFVPGLIYVINHTDLGRIIKRLDRTDTHGPTGERYMFCGDNPSSTPQAVIGPVTPDRIIGRAVLAICQSGIKRLR